MGNIVCDEDQNVQAAPNLYENGNAGEELLSPQNNMEADVNCQRDTVGVVVPQQMHNEPAIQEALLAAPMEFVTLPPPPKKEPVVEQGTRHCTGEGHNSPQ